MAQSLQKFSRLYEDSGSKIQSELKELEIYLAYNFASRFKETLLSKISLTSVVLFRPVSGERKSPASYYHEIEFPEGSSVFSPRPSLLKAFNRPLSKAKEWAIQRRYTKRYPKLRNFWTNFVKTGIHGVDVCPISLNLHQVR